MTNIRVLRKLGYFVALSVVAHLWFLYGIPFELPRFKSAAPALEARLQPAPPLPPVIPRVPVRPASPAAESVTSSPNPSAATVYPAPPPAPPELVAVEAPPAAPSVVADSKPASAPPLARRLPRKGEISYVLYLGNDKFAVGVTTQTWEISGERYRMQSVSETTGLAAVFSRQRIAYESHGRLTGHGLQPERFTTERMRSGKTENAGAEFNWSAASAVVGNPPRSVALPDDTQDIVSFMYQLGLAPLTPGRIELPVTNGWKLERYALDIGIEEMLETPFGVLRAVPIRQVRAASQETIELWLAPAYRWLPVRIRFFNREGEPAGEQLVTAIRVSED